MPLGPPMFPITLPLCPQQSGHSLLWAPPKGLEGACAQPVLRPGTPTARTNPPLHAPPLSAQPGSGHWPKKGGTIKRPHPHLPPPILTANLHHLFPTMLLSEAFNNSPAAPRSKPGPFPGMASGLPYIWSPPTCQPCFSPHPHRGLTAEQILNALALASPSSCFLCSVHSSGWKSSPFLRRTTKPITWKNSSQHPSHSYFLLSPPSFPFPPLSPFSPLFHASLSHTHSVTWSSSIHVPLGLCLYLRNSTYFSLLWNRIHLCLTSQLKTASLECQSYSFFIHICTFIIVLAPGFFIHNSFSIHGWPLSTVTWWTEPWLWQWTQLNLSAPPLSISVWPWTNHLRTLSELLRSKSYKMWAIIVPTHWVVRNDWDNVHRTCNSCCSSSRFLINVSHQLHLTNTFKELDPVEWISGGKATRTFALEDKDDLLSTWACLQKGWQRLQGFLRKGVAQNWQPQAL